MQIVIPSYSRSDSMTTDRLFPTSVVVVCEKQYQDYKDHGHDRLLKMPDEFEGNISKKRNWILNYFDDDVLMLDDDYIRVGFHQDGLQFDLPPERIEFLIENGFSMAKELGTVLWGLNVQKDPRFYREYAPFSLLNPILGPWQGIVKNSLRYDERIQLKEDYDYSLQVLYKYHKVLRFNKYFYDVKHLKNEGGVNATRTQDKEVQQIQLLKKKWGNIINVGRRTQKGNYTVNPTISLPIKGV